MQEEIRLSRTGWWKEFEQKNLPQDIIVLLRGLIGCYLGSAILPDATPQLITLAKEYLSKGIWIGNNDLFDVMVYMPNNPTFHRSFFALANKWPGGELKRLSEL